MPDSGTQSWIGLGAQTNWAGSSVARTKFMRHLRAEGGLSQNIWTSDSLTATAGKRAYSAAGKLVKFTTEHRMEYEGLEPIIKRALGAVNSAQQGGTSAYKHSFTLHNDRPMATVERCFGTKSLLHPANKITAWHFEGTLFEAPKCRFDWLGRDEDALASPSSPSFSTEMPVVPVVSASTLIKLGANSFKVESWELSGDEPLREDAWYIGNVLTIKEPVRVEKRTVTGRVTMEFDGSDSNMIALYAAFQGATESSFQAIYVGAQIGATGYYYTSDLQCARIMLTGEPPPVTGPGFIPLTLTFEALDDATGTPAAATLDITNEVTAVT